MKTTTKRSAAALKTMTSITGIAVLGASATLAVFLHSWEIGGAGLLACAGLAAVDVLRAKKKPLVLPPTTLDEPKQIKDVHTALVVTAILEARKQLERALEESPTELTADLTAALAQMAELEAHASKLARRAEEIAVWLARSDPQALQREIGEMDKRLRATTDAATRAHYMSARNARSAHYATLRELAQAKERIGATLLSIAATFEALPAKVVRLRGLEGAACDATRDVGRELTVMNEEMASFEDTLIQLSESS